MKCVYQSELKWFLTHKFWKNVKINVLTHTNAIRLRFKTVSIIFRKMKMIVHIAHLAYVIDW